MFETSPHFFGASPNQIASTQNEILGRQKWSTKLEVASAIADYLKPLYNEAQRHSSLNYLTLNEFEVLDSRLSQAAVARTWCPQLGQAVLERATGIDPAFSA